MGRYLLKKRTTGIRLMILEGIKKQMAQPATEPYQGLHPPIRLPPAHSGDQDIGGFDKLCTHGSITTFGDAARTIYLAGLVSACCEPQINRSVVDMTTRAYQVIDPRIAEMRMAARRIESLRGNYPKQILSGRSILILGL